MYCFYLFAACFSTIFASSPPQESFLYNIENQGQGFRVHTQPLHDLAFVKDQIKAEVEKRRKERTARDALSRVADNAAERYHTDLENMETHHVIVEGINENKNLHRPEDYGERLRHHYGEWGKALLGAHRNYATNRKLHSSLKLKNSEGPTQYWVAWSPQTLDRGQSPTKETDRKEQPQFKSMPKQQPQSTSTQNSKKRKNKSKRKGSKSGSKKS